MRIRHLDLGSSPVVLAPMEDVTDHAFRLFCRRMGASMVYSEFVQADALVRKIPRTMQKLHLNEDERPVAIQVYGRDAGSVSEAARIVVDEVHPDVIDINFGCPVKKVAGKGAGAGLLQNIPLMLQITRAVVDAVPEVPVTVKTRLGWDQDHRIIVELAEQLQDCGIEALTVHGRTRAQMYTGEADWELIAQTKANPRLHIPLIGNGDVSTPERAKECFERYGVDAVMIGRATFGRPWIFYEMAQALGYALPAVEDFSTHEPLSVGWKMDVLRKQIAASVACNEEKRGILHIRRHLAATPLFKSIPNFRQTRIKMLRTERMEELMEILDDIEQILISLQ